MTSPIWARDNANRPVAHRQIGRGELVEAEQRHHRLHSWGIDKQCEENESGYEDADKGLHISGDGRVFNHGKGQRQRYGTAQPAPEHHGLVARAHALGEADEIEDRQEPVEDRSACREPGDHQHYQQAEFGYSGIAQDLRHDDADEHEDQRIRPEPELLPGFLQSMPRLRRDGGAADRL